MLRDSLNIMLLLLTIGALMAWSLFYGQTNIKVDTIQENLTKALRVSVIENRDQSARVAPGVFYLDEQGFETKFVEYFEKDSHIKKGNYENLTFDYLVDEDKKSNNASMPKPIKAVKVKLTVQGAEYKAITIVDIKE